MLAAGLVTVLYSAVLLTATQWLPLAWDEGDAILRAERIARWVGEVVTPGDGRALAESFSKPAIENAWPFTTQREGHPAAYAIVIAAGRAAGGAWLSPPVATRLGSIVLFSLAGGAMCYRLASQFSTRVALAAALCLLALPRLFAHAQFAHYDGQLTSWWILSWCAFEPARRGTAGRLALGLALGLALSTKATGWLAPLPFFIWAVVYRDRRGLAALAIAIPLALATFFVLNPPLWHDPHSGLAKFFELNLHRASEPGMNITIQFLGRLYNLDHPLPWYNTLFWIAVTVPVPMLLFAALGVGKALGHPIRERGTMLLVAHLATLLVVRALPLAPPHDGVRLFLPAFAFLAMLAAVGCGQSVAWAQARFAERPSARWLALAAIAVLLLAPLWNLFWYAPQWLSYYNLVIGGLRGATAAGMEPTYYWDALDRDVLDWLHTHTTEDEKIYFAAAPPDNLALLHRWGRLQRGYRPEDPGTYRWYVLQRRPSAWRPVDRRLIKDAAPAYQKTIRPAASGFGPWRLDVPLVEVYDYRDYLRARRSAAEENGHSRGSSGLSAVGAAESRHTVGASHEETLPRRGSLGKRPLPNEATGWTCTIRLCTSPVPTAFGGYWPPLS